MESNETSAEEKVEVIRGLMRPFLAVSLIIIYGYLAVKGKIPAEITYTNVTTIIAFYFAERSQKNQSKVETPKSDRESTTGAPDVT